MSENKPKTSLAEVIATVGLLSVVGVLVAYTFIGPSTDVWYAPDDVNAPPITKQVDRLGHKVDKLLEDHWSITLDNMILILIIADYKWDGYTDEEKKTIKDNTRGFIERAKDRKFTPDQLEKFEDIKKRLEELEKR